jgi:hypothetical protein
MKYGGLYDPTPKNFGKIYNPLDENPSGVMESFARYFWLSLKNQCQ